MATEKSPRPRMEATKAPGCRRVPLLSLRLRLDAYLKYNTATGRFAIPQPATLHIAYKPMRGRSNQVPAPL